MSSQRAFSQIKVVSQFEKWNEQPCDLIMTDLQELHWTNEPKAERICATCLGYTAQTVSYEYNYGSMRPKDDRHYGLNRMITFVPPSLETLCNKVIAMTPEAELPAL